MILKPRHNPRIPPIWATKSILFQKFKSFQNYTFEWLKVYDKSKKDWLDLGYCKTLLNANLVKDGGTSFALDSQTFSQQFAQQTDQLHCHDHHHHHSSLLVNLTTVLPTFANLFCDLKSTVKFNYLYPQNQLQICIKI